LFTGLNFSAVANNDITVECVVTKKSDGSLADLTGYYIKVQGWYPNGTTGAFEYDTSTGGVVIMNQTASKGHFQFTIRAADSINFPAGDYKWDAVTVFSGRALSIRNNDLKLTPGIISFTREVAVQP
jgi:hypothetical protein